MRFLEDAEPAPMVSERRRRATPWHLWLVGGVSLLWNLMGAVDYTFTHLRNSTWIAAGADRMGISPAEMTAYIESFPTWMHAFWAIGVWGAIVGSVLLLLRSRFAGIAFGASLLGLVVTQLYRVMTPQPAWMQGDAMFNILLWSAASFLLIYAISMRRKSVLR